MALGWRGPYLRYKDYFLNIVDLYKKRADLRAFLEIILSLSTIIVFLIFALKPTILTIISLAQQINEKRSTITLLDQKIKNLEIASGFFNQNQNAIPNIETAISTSPNLGIVTTQIQTVATRNSVSVSGISIGQIDLIGQKSSSKKTADTKPLPGNAMEMPISINIRGDYFNLLSFLKDFENLKMIIKIDSLMISASTITISGRVPYLGT